ncbi:hypothetical protein [Sinimarinibacterium thermocellulolyticum]|uniref:Uncharacterized protein n=1 Tax=Sinimarinibacterium thermocellulolyticum TaxID=3170016 RepID=A0ABV2ACI6_9GAMM
MISKPPRSRSRSAKQQDPLEVDLTVSLRFGDETDERITPINRQRIPMVNSVFQNRDRILRTFVTLMFRAGLSSPKVVGHLIPSGARKRRRG